MPRQSKKTPLGLTKWIVNLFSPFSRKSISQDDQTMYQPNLDILQETVQDPPLVLATKGRPRGPRGRRPPQNKIKGSLNSLDGLTDEEF